MQEGAYKRVGGNRWQRTRFRLVSATHRDLAQEAAADRSGTTSSTGSRHGAVRLPPLRERPDDVLVLARQFLERLDGTAPPLDPVVERHLCRRRYPGNVRELKHWWSRWPAGTSAPARYARRPADGANHRRRPSAGTTVTSPRRSAARYGEGAGLREIGDAATDVAVDMALHEAGGSVRAASERLGVTPRALQLRAARRRMTLVGATEARFAGGAVQAKDRSSSPPSAA